MSIVTGSLGVTLKISDDLKAALKSSPTIQEREAFVTSTLTPLTRRLKHEPIASNVVRDMINAGGDDSLATKKGIDRFVEDNDDSSEALNVLEEASAPRRLGESMEDDAEDNLSHHAPPPHLPLVLVNLEKICGYVPCTGPELEAVKDQIRAALNEDEFDERVTELFQMKIARHGDTSWNVSDGQQFFGVEYPEFLCTPDSQILYTARIWKKFFCKHKIRVVNRILNHLMNCNRSLLWKSDMYDALVELARSEDYARREAQLEKWRSVDRKAQLDRLYQVRETFHHRLELAQIALEQLEDERDHLVAQQLGRGLQALDLKSNIFFVADAMIRPTNTVLEYASYDLDAEDISGNDDHPEDDSDGGQLFERGNSEMVLDFLQSGHQTGELLPNDSDGRRARALKRHRERLQNAAQQALEKQKIEAALAEEDRLIEEFTSQELLKAQAVVQSLQRRTQQVDDLLESLQDDEWADEEEGFTPRKDNTPSDPEDQLSLLDQILAMILGSLSPPCNDNTEDPDNDHFRYLRSEHEAILFDWKEYFGRLPAATGKTKPGRSPSPSALRAELGIFDNDQEWDEHSHDGDHSISTTEAKTSEPCSSDLAEPVTYGGLRPGGSAEKPTV